MHTPAFGKLSDMMTERRRKDESAPEKTYKPGKSHVRLQYVKKDSAALFPHWNIFMGHGPYPYCRNAYVQFQYDLP
jgi:hypothetical protein